MRKIKCWLAINYFKKLYNQKKITFFWQRDSVIYFFFFKTKVHVYNGKKWKKFYVLSQRLFKKFGEFSFTRKLCVYKKKKLKKKLHGKKK